MYCKYLNISDCTTILGDATIGGGNMVTSYLLLQYDSYYASISQGGSIYSQSTIQTVVRLNIFYMFRMIEVSNIEMTKDY